MISSSTLWIRSALMAAAVVSGMGCGEDIEPRPFDAGLDAGEAFDGGFDGGFDLDAEVPRDGGDGDGGPPDPIVEGPAQCLERLGGALGFESIEEEGIMEGRIATVSADVVVVSMPFGEERFSWVGADPSAVFEAGEFVEIELRRGPEGREESLRSDEFELTVAEVPFGEANEAQWDGQVFAFGEDECRREESVSRCGGGPWVRHGLAMFYQGRRVNALTPFSIDSSNYTAVRALRELGPCGEENRFAVTRFRVLDAP